MLGRFALYVSIALDHSLKIWYDILTSKKLILELLEV